MILLHFYQAIISKAEASKPLLATIQVVKQTIYLYLLKWYYMSLESINDNAKPFHYETIIPFPKILFIKKSL